MRKLTAATIVFLLLMTPIAAGTGGADAFADATAIHAFPYEDRSTNTTATTEAEERTYSCGPFGKTLWYRFEATQGTLFSASTAGSNFDTVLTAYTGTSLRDLSEIACSDDAGGELTSAVEFRAQVTGTVYLQIGGFSLGVPRDLLAASGQLVLSVSQGDTVPAPSNDHFASSAAIAALPFEHDTDTRTATTEDGEPQPSCVPAGGTVWFTHTPAATGVVVAHAGGGGADPVVAAYSGDALGTLTEVGCDDDGGTGVDARLRIPVTGGVPVHIQLGSVGPGGVVRFTLDAAPPPPAHDAFADAHLVGPLPFEHEADTTMATAQDGEPTPCVPITNTVWYRLEPSASGPVTLSTAGSDFDTVLAVYTGSGLSDLVLRACNDDAMEFSSEVYVDARAGQTLYVQAGGFGDAGHLVLGVRAGIPPTAPPLNDDRANAKIIDALPFTQTVHMARATREDPEDSCIGARSTVWYRYTPAGEEHVLADVTSVYESYLSVYVVNDVILERVACLSYFNEPHLLTVAAGRTYYFQVESDGELFEDDRVEFSLTRAPVVDLAVTALSVHNVPIQTDAGDLPSHLRRTVHVTVANLGPGSDPRGVLHVAACPRTAGYCRDFAYELLPLAAGESRDFVFDWKGTGDAGDFTVIAEYQSPTIDDPNAANNRRAVEHYVVAGNTGVGVGTGCVLGTNC